MFSAFVSQFGENIENNAKNENHFVMAPCPCDVKYLAQQIRNISNTCHFNTCKKSWRNWAEVVVFYTWGGGVYFF